MRMKVELFVENIWISTKSDLISIFDKTGCAINRFNAKNRTSTSSNILRGASDSISLIITNANISSVTNECSISLFADKKNVVTIFKGAIQSVSMGNSLQSLSKSLLSLIDQQLIFVLLVIIISLFVGIEIDIL